MSFYQRINNDLKDAMKAGDNFKVSALRMFLSVFHNKEIEKKGKGLEPALTDEEIIEILGREAKKRKESAEIYIKGGRQDLAGKESGELEIINKYLPEQIGSEEIEKIVAAIIEKTGAKDIKNFGKVMGEAMKELKGKADASLVSEIVRKKLGS